MRGVRIALRAAVALGALAIAAPALGARPSYVIPSAALPGDVATARTLLYQARQTAPAGSVTHRDIDYALRLGARMMKLSQPPGRRATAALTLRVNAWWYSRRPAPSLRVIARLPDGILATYWGGRGFAINPVATAGRWQDLNVHVSPEALASALLPLGVQRNAGHTRFLLWEYYDVPDKPGVITPGASGMAQGRMAQLMARAYHRTGDRRFATAARGALAAFTVPVKQGGVVSEVADPAGVPPMPWYVERAYPGANPWKGAALNGFMVTLLNLHATAPLLRGRPLGRGSGSSEVSTHPAAGSQEAGDLALELMRAGEQTLVQYLPTHDTGTWSLYGLLTPGRPWKSYLADEGYHCYHVSLLRQLNRISPELGFGDVADRWNDYALRVGVTCEPGSLPPPSTPPPGALGGPGVPQGRDVL